MYSADSWLWYIFAIMLKHLVILAIFVPLGLAGGSLNQSVPIKRVAGPANNLDGHKQTGSQNNDANTAKTPNVVIQVDTPQRETDGTEHGENLKIERENVRIQRILAVLTSLLVGVGVLQAIALLLQVTLLGFHGKHFHDIAKIADRQTSHMVTSERAWMVASVERLHVPHSQLSNDKVNFSVRCVNKGKTPAFLLEIANHGVTHPRDTILPAVQPPYEPQNVEKWERDGLPILPGADIVRHNLTVTSCPEKIHTGQDDFWMYGYIKYRDAFGVDRETRYCFLWDNNCSESIEEERPSCFMPRGPAYYNCTT